MSIKQTFILRSLIEYNERVSSQMKMAAARLKIGVTGEGIASIAHKAAAQGNGAAGELSFKEYLRMVDMGTGRGNPLGGLRTMRVALQSNSTEGDVFIKKKRKPKKFYSKIAYGNLTWLQNKLLYGYTQETIAMLKQEMQTTQPLNP